MLYKITRWLGKIILKVYFRVHIKGLENIPDNEACIVVANHASFLDPFLISIIAPRVIHYITYAFFYYHPACHWFCKRTYCIPLKKDGKDISALKKSLQLLKGGEIVAIFPEGKRSETGQLGKGEPGVALIALKAGVPILPVGIQGAYESYPKGSKFPKPATLTVNFGKPFRLTEALPKEASSNDEFQIRAVEFIMDKIAEVCRLKEVSPPQTTVVTE
jgi:1-acyl-sn-glycerol-3-phosphate acyltransferase